MCLGELPQVPGAFWKPRTLHLVGGQRPAACSPAFMVRSLLTVVLRSSSLVAGSSSGASSGFVGSSRGHTPDLSSCTPPGELGSLESPQHL